MKTNPNNKRARNKVNYKDSEGSDEDISVQDLERNRSLNVKTQKDSSIKSEDDEFNPIDDSEFEMVENSEEKDDCESISMQIDDMSIDSKGKKKNIKNKPKKKVAPKANEEENEKDVSSLASDGKKVKKSRKKNEGKEEKKPKNKINGELNKDGIIEKAKKKEMKEKEKQEKKEKREQEKKEKQEKKEQEKIEKKNKRDQAKKEILDSSYDIQKNYFYQTLSQEELKKIENFFENYFMTLSPFDVTEDTIKIKNYLNDFPNLRKGHFNVEKLKKM